MPLPQHCQADRPRNKTLADPTASMPLPESSSMPSLLNSNGLPGQYEDPYASEFGLDFNFPGGNSAGCGGSQHSENGSEGENIQPDLAALPQSPTCGKW